MKRAFTWIPIVEHPDLVKTFTCARFHGLSPLLATQQASALVRLMLHFEVMSFNWKDTKIGPESVSEECPKISFDFAMETKVNKRARLGECLWSFLSSTGNLRSMGRAE
jgi:hypothetical protein